jgi:hypothetical protein
MRDLWDTRVAQGRGLVTLPQKLASSAIKRLMERAIWAQGLRKRLEYGEKRHPYQANHCWRKWFKTRCEISGMKTINIETLLSHSVGISDSYYRPTETDPLDDYLKAVDMLIIDCDTLDLQKKIIDLQEKSKDNQCMTKKLVEKDEEMKTLRRKYDSDIALLKDTVSDMQQLLKNPKKLSEIASYPSG